jgi:hypothetical protein
MVMSDLKKKLAEARIKAAKHPGGKNLNIIDSTEMARELQLNSAASRKKNNEAKADAERLLQEFKKRGEEMAALNLKGLDVMKLIMGDAIVKGDTRTAAALAAQVAEYETPKLTRQEVHSTVMDVTELSDSELEELLNLEKETVEKGVH